MFDPTHARGEVQPALFELTRSETDPPEALARWVYPCGLCGTVEVTEAGGLCTECSPVRLRKPNRTRTTAKKTAKKTAARSSRAGKPAKVTNRPEAASGGGR